MPVGVQDLAPGQGVQLDEVEGGNQGLKENPASSRNPKEGTPKVGGSHSAYCVVLPSLHRCVILHTVNSALPEHSKFKLALSLTC